MNADDILKTFCGGLIAVGFLGAVLFGTIWAFCEGYGIPTEWPRGLTFAALVPFASGFFAAQFLA